MFNRPKKLRSVSFTLFLKTKQIVKLTTCKIDDLVVKLTTFNKILIKVNKNLKTSFEIVEYVSFYI